MGGRSQTGNEDWDQHMGLINPKIGELRKMLFGVPVSGFSEKQRLFKAKDLNKV